MICSGPFMAVLLTGFTVICVFVSGQTACLPRIKVLKIFSMSLN